MSDDDTLATNSGPVVLRRLPDQGHGPLRAWDAADEYLLDHLASQCPGPGRWLIVNDLFGALAVALADQRPESWNDSVTSHQATVANLERNGLDVDLVRCVRSDEAPTGPVDVVVIKVPRTLALLEDQLRRLRPLLHPGTLIVGAGMVKSIHRSTLELFESIIGPSPTSLAKKKARLIHTSLDPTLSPDVSPFPSDYQLADGSRVIEHANVFSRGHLDIGTRAMLDHLPAAGAGADVLDLGCGNGLLGLHVARQTKVGSVTFVDESYHAIASARANVDEWLPDLTARFVIDRTLDTVPSASVDLVVNNPPFHTHQSRSDGTARAMFVDAHRVLRPGGQLVVVGNRHLDYHQQLRRRFGRCEVLGSTSKFVVLSAFR